MHRSARKAGLILSALLCSASAASQPFVSVDQNPMLQMFGLPAAAPATLLAYDKQSLQLYHDRSNTTNFEQSRRESLLLDGESSHWQLQFDYSFTPEWQLSFSLPHLQHSAGGLDNFIDQFHTAFGFPQGDRPSYPADQLHYRYQRDGVERLNLSQSLSGWQDLRIAIGRTLLRLIGTRSALWAELKLPTSSDSSGLLSNNASSLSGQWSLETNLAYQWQLQSNLGLLWLEKGNFLADMQKQWVGFGALGLQWRPTQLISLQLQLNGHSAFYDSELLLLGPSVQLAIGGSLHFSRNNRLDISVIEDIQVAASPDVNFHLNLWQRW